jgi:uncharacterized membrane protein HdeD (DUF308 family)
MTTAADTDHAHRSRYAAVATVDARRTADYWWVWLITAVAWIVAALVILQFDAASITTIGVIVGCMFVFAGVQLIVHSAVGGGWLPAVVGVLFLLAGAVCFVNPEATFVGLADILGFLFATVAIWWTVEAFVSRGENPVWWVGLATAVLMFVVAFWVAGQFFIEKAYVLLVFAGIWALLKGVRDIVYAFSVRGLRRPT